jgi:Flp pilus assembly CpaF family ATPase
MASIKAFGIIVEVRGEGRGSREIAEIAVIARNRKSKGITTKDTKEREGKPLKG